MKNKQQPFDAREIVKDLIASDFNALQEQLTTGLQVLLELHGVAPSARVAVREYMGDVVRGLGRMEAASVRTVNFLGEAEPGMDPKEHGHPTLSSLFEEIRHDESERKREEAGGSLREILGVKNESPSPEPAKERGRGIER